jgi:amidase
MKPSDSNAFVEQFDFAPTGTGPLDGLRFAVKDLIDVAGYKTGCGNPTWLATHPAATVNAVCVEQLLAAGARCVGKTVTDELAFSLLGENQFYGTPLNPKAPERMPGGSSSGSASAVACKLVDFALGTDTGGSVRFPANNCGIWGFRPSHGFISVAGVNPFAPTFDTVGVLARSATIVVRAAAVLLACKIPPAPQIGEVHFITDAFDLVDPENQASLKPPVESLQEYFGDRSCFTTLREVVGSNGPMFAELSRTYSLLQWAEIDSSLGAWIADAKPEFGPAIAANFELVKTLDRRLVVAAIHDREKLYRQLQTFLGPNDLLCIPTTPAFAPKKGSLLHRGQGGGNYYPRALGLTSITGLGRLPQVSLPITEHEGLPIGISLIGRYGEDAFLLRVAEQIAAALCDEYPTLVD